jgi:CRP/FNR family transcriptional regulator
MEVPQQPAAVSSRVAPTIPKFAATGAIPLSAGGGDLLASLGTSVAFQKRSAILHEGEESDWLFRIADGVVKLHRVLPDGRCQIVGLRFSGDFLGLDRGGAASHSAYAVGQVLADRFSRRAVEQLCESSAPVSRLLLLWTNHELAAAQGQMLLLACMTPREKFASFLLSLIRRQRNPDLIRLPMTRTDIAGYLGLTLETVSRTMSQFRRDGLIWPLDCRGLRILDLAGIAHLADCTGTTQRSPEPDHKCVGPDRKGAGMASRQAMPQPEAS